MKTQIAEWLWRLALLAALGWIGRELQLIHQDLGQPAGDQAMTAAVPDDVQNSLDEIHDDLVTLGQKVDALMIAMLHGKS